MGFDFPDQFTRGDIRVDVHDLASRAFTQACNHRQNSPVRHVANGFQVHFGDVSHQAQLIAVQVIADKHTVLDALRHDGISPLQPMPDELVAALISLDQENGPEYWLDFNNFYAITRYNHSPLYAMAVYQLSEEIRTAYEKTRLFNE